jgi:Fur family ferric uptake transcriptional regulator
VHSTTEAVIETLVRRGGRMTQPRRAVIDVITRAESSIDVSELYARSRKQHPQVGLATVYRTLDMLEEIGLVKRVNIDGRAHVVACADQSLHFHLVCERCHSVTELHAEEEESLRRLARARGFEPVNRAVEVVGRCAECRG